MNTKKAACSFRMFERSYLRQRRLFTFIRHALHLHGANPGWHAIDPRMGAKAHSIRELLDIRDGITTLADFDTDDVILDELCRS